MSRKRKTKEKKNKEEEEGIEQEISLPVLKTAKFCPASPPTVTAAAEPTVPSTPNKLLNHNTGFLGSCQPSSDALTELVKGCSAKLSPSSLAELSADTDASKQLAEELGIKSTSHGNVFVCRTAHIDFITSGIEFELPASRVYLIDVAGDIKEKKKKKPNTRSAGNNKEQLITQLRSTSLSEDTKDGHPSVVLPMAEGVEQDAEVVAAQVCAIFRWIVDKIASSSTTTPPVAPVFHFRCFKGANRSKGTAAIVYALLANGWSMTSNVNAVETLGPSQVKEFKEVAIKATFESLPFKYGALKGQIVKMDEKMVKMDEKIVKLENQNKEMRKEMDEKMAALLGVLDPEAKEKFAALIKALQPSPHQQQQQQQ